MAVAPQSLDQSTTKTSARTDNNRPRHNYTFVARSVHPNDPVVADSQVVTFE